MSYNSAMAEIIVVHGTPGAGKSTHSERLANYSINERPVFHISAGNRLRDIRIGVVESAYSSVINSPDAPSLLDHRVVNGVIFEFVSQCPENSIVLVDGYPRFSDATGVFLETIKEGNHTLLGCINLNISLETSTERLSGRGMRSGERIKGGSSAEFAEKRYADHLKYTNEAVQTLGEVARVINVDAESDLNTVWEAYNEAFKTLTTKE